MYSRRITLGTYSRSGTVVNSFNEAEYTRGGLRAAIADARVSAEDQQGYWSRNGGVREEGVCVAVFPHKIGAPMRIVARFPFAHSKAV